MALYVTGDVHYPIDADKLADANDVLSENDILVVMGDMGIVWYDETISNHRIKELSNIIKYKLLFIDGNHEHHPLLNSYPVKTAYGGKIHRISDNILHMMRGEKYNIEGKNILVFGGAWSIDKIYRKDGVDWFKEEEFNHTESENCLDHINELKEYDYIFTHDAPDNIAKTLCQYYQSTSTSKFLNEIQDIVSFDRWYFGHYHLDCFRKQKKYICLYNKIREAETGNVVKLKRHRIISSKYKTKYE